MEWGRANRPQFLQQYTPPCPEQVGDLFRLGADAGGAAPERMVWGSNWPHTNETTKPDDAMLFGLMSKWAPDEPTRNRILVQNAAELYGFGKVS